MALHNTYVYVLTIRSWCLGLGLGGLVIQGFPVGWSCHLTPKSEMFAEPPDVCIPEGSKDPNNWVLGPKCYNITIWNLKPDYLGPWTLRDCALSQPLDRQPYLHHKR